VQPGRGSLAEVLPDSIRQLLGRAASSFDEFSTIAWSGPSGRQFDWRVCRPEPEAPAIAAPAAVPALAADDFAPAADVGARAVMAVSDWLGGDGAPGGEGAPDRDRSTGVLVHRLFQQSGSGQEVDRVTAARLLGPEERAGIDDPEATIAQALDAWGMLRAKVEALTDGAWTWFEVPFSLQVDEAGRPSTVLRGAIDCLAIRDDGSVIVIELKTGRKRAVHQDQLDLYVRAAATLFPGARIQGALLYPD